MNIEEIKKIFNDLPPEKIAEIAQEAKRICQEAHEEAQAMIKKMDANLPDEHKTYHTHSKVENLEAALKLCCEALESCLERTFRNRDHINGVVEIQTYQEFDDKKVYLALATAKKLLG